MARSHSAVNPNLAAIFFDFFSVFGKKFRRAPFSRIDAPSVIRNEGYVRFDFFYELDIFFAKNSFYRLRHGNFFSDFRNLRGCFFFQPYEIPHRFNIVRVDIVADYFRSASGGFDAFKEFFVRIGF